MGDTGRIRRLAAGSAFLVVVALVVLIVVGASESGGDGDPSHLVGSRQVDSLLVGLEQARLSLGDPRAPVELVEYGDLQCPHCKGDSEEILPAVIKSQVRSGRARLAFRNYAILGAQSSSGGEAAIAAGMQGRGWNFLQLFYRNQGGEDSGYVTDEFLAALARAAGVANLTKWNRDRKSKAVAAEVARTTEEAESLGFTGTPSFAIQGPRSDGLEPIGGVESAESLEAAIEGAI